MSIAQLSTIAPIAIIDSLDRALNHICMILEGGVTYIIMCITAPAAVFIKEQFFCLAASSLGS